MIRERKPSTTDKTDGPLQPAAEDEIRKDRKLGHEPKERGRTRTREEVRASKVPRKND